MGNDNFILIFHNVVVNVLIYTPTTVILLDLSLSLNSKICVYLQGIRFSVAVFGPSRGQVLMWLLMFMLLLYCAVVVVLLMLQLLYCCCSDCDCFRCCCGCCVIVIVVVVGVIFIVIVVVVAIAFLLGFAVDISVLFAVKCK